MINKIFHPFEFAICGYSGSGKTYLIKKLLQRLSSDYHIGFVKHDAHCFEIDREGKDSSNLFDAKFNNLNMDFVLVEGYKTTEAPKLVVLGDGDCKIDIINDFRQGKLKNVLGFIGVENHCPFTSSLPYFQRDNIEQIVQFILTYLKNQTEKIPVYGLILAGGLSKRMGQDKGALNYHGQPQTHYCFDMLSQLCHETFISCREEQKDLPHLKDLPQIHDSFPVNGPLGGILSAMEQKPGAWLVVACDLPYLDVKNLNKLIRGRNHFKTATCFTNQEKGWLEPLCTIYEPKAFSRFLQFFSFGYHCPRKMLMNSSVKSIIPDNQDIIINANRPEDYGQVTGRI